MIQHTKYKKKHIVFICDDNYVLPTIVAIKSLISNLKFEMNDLYNIHICSFHLEKEKQIVFENMKTDKILITIHLIDINKYQNKITKINQKTHVTPTALLKFELANILLDADEVLYLDSDLIIKKDIAEIFKYDITDYYLAASFEFWTYMVKVFEFENNNLPEFTFNSGVMLMNLKKFREHNLPKLLWETKFAKCNQYNKVENMMDQNVFNLVCVNKCLHIPIKFNCNNQFTEKINIEDINKAYNTQYKSLLELKNDAIIIHFVGKQDKPWLFEGMPCQEIWDKYCKMSLISLSELNRKEFKKGIKHYFNRLIRSIEVRGIRKTIKYLDYKRKNI